ncbi:MAG TPA: hypothetical protein VES39_01315, partial [Rhodospirillales bacterium]|nr:hypothetical protein [Rhodospirillales bacterium]
MTAPERTFSGNEAEEELQRLLALDFGKQGLPKPEEQGVCGLLWVEQGTGFGVDARSGISGPSIGDSGRRALGRALEQELEQVVGGDLAAALVTAAEQRCNQFFQPKRGGEKGDYAAAKQAVEELQARCERLHDEARSFDALLAELEQVRARLAEHAEAGGIAAAEAEVQRLEAEQQRLDALRVKLEQAEAAETLARSRLDLAVQRQAARATTIEAALRTAAEAAQAQADRQAAEQALDPLQAALLDAEAAAGEAARAAGLAVAVDEAADHALRRARAAHELAGLTAAAQRAEAATAAAAQARSAAAAIAVDDEALRRVRAAVAAAATARMRLEAAETRIDLAPLPSRSAFLGDRELPEGQPLRLDAPTTLRLDGWGELTITPGGEDLDRRRADAAQANSALATLLAALGIADPAAAEAAAEQRRDGLAAAAEAGREAERWAPEGLAALQRALHLKAAEVSELDGGAAVPPLPPEAAEAERRRAREAAAAARTLHEEARERLRTATAAHAQARDRVSAARARGEAAGPQAEAQDVALAQARAVESDAALKAAVDAARGELTEQQLQRGLVGDAWAGQEPEQTAAKLAAAHRRRQDLAMTIDDLKRRDRELKIDLRGFGKYGLDEERTRTEGEIDLARRHLARLQREADAARLLR